MNNANSIDTAENISADSVDFLSLLTSLQNGDDKLTVSELFDKAYALYDDINSGVYSTNDERKSKVLYGIRLLKKLNDLANQMQLFPANNESYDELPSKQLRIILVNALLANFLQSKPCELIEKRLVIVDEAIFCCRQFLSNCRLLLIYETKNCPLSHTDIDGMIDKCDRPCILKHDQTKTAGRQFDVTLAAKTRRQKIDNYRKSKNINETISNLQNQCSLNPSDEALHRELCINQIHFWLLKINEDLACLLEERCLLISRKSEPSLDSLPLPNSKTGLETRCSSAKPITPFTLLTTRQDRARQVLGAGYPSLPTLSIEQFYDSLKDRGILSHCHQLPSSNSEKKNPLTDEEIQVNIDNAIDKGDDDEYVKHKRDMDDWKDQHWRNEGNRNNRS
ncbi:hypothetical protein GJ496_003244 [Pomphorhynchus laevis]|nr:hypothetical protein GJ496_003244 [Pomphorhynchus laevis]